MNIKGVGIGRGVAVGPVIRMAAPLPEPSDAPRAESISAETEIARVEKSLALVNADLNRRAEEAANGDEGAKQAAPILQAIAMFASDPSLAQSIKDLINQGKTAERAVLEGFGAVEDMFRAIGGYQAERAADLHDVGQRVIADLMGAPAPGLPVSETPFVLVAEDLSPADTAALDMSKTLAIVTSQGGPTSHTAILARARGIVAVVSAAEAAELENGTNVIVNAAKGEIVVNPSEDEIAAAEAAKSRAAAAKELRGKPGATKDGHLIPLLANVGKPSDAAKALEGRQSFETWTEAFLDILHQIQENKVLVLNVYRSVGREQVEQYLYKMLDPMLKDFADRECRDITVQDDDKQFVVDFYKYALVGVVLEWVRRDMKTDPAVIVERMGRMLQGDMRRALCRLASNKIHMVQEN